MKLQMVFIIRHCVWLHVSSATVTTTVETTENHWRTPTPSGRRREAGQHRKGTNIQRCTSAHCHGTATGGHRWPAPSDAGRQLRHRRVSYTVKLTYSNGRRGRSFSAFDCAGGVRNVCYSQLSLFRPQVRTPNRDAVDGRDFF